MGWDAFASPTPHVWKETKSKKTSHLTTTPIHTPPRGSLEKCVWIVTFYIFLGFLSAGRGKNHVVSYAWTSVSDCHVSKWQINTSFIREIIYSALTHQLFRATVNTIAVQEVDRTLYEIAVRKWNKNWMGWGGVELDGGGADIYWKRVGVHSGGMHTIITIIAIIVGGEMVLLWCRESHHCAYLLAVFRNSKWMI